MSLYVVTISLGYEEGRGILGIFAELADARAAMHNQDDRTASIEIIPINTLATSQWCDWPKL